MSELSMLARRLRMSEREVLEATIGEAIAEGADAILPATPFVSVYEGGRLVGCQGHVRLARALDAARRDQRFVGALGVDQTLQVTLLSRPRRMSPARASRSLELGSDGLVLLPDGTSGGAATVLLPDVAVDSRLSAKGMLDALARKSGRALGREVLLVASERFVFRPGGAIAPSRASVIDEAAGWLARQIGSDGSIAWGLDARARRAHPSGAFHLGRASVVLEALELHGSFETEVRRARAWLAAELARALAAGTLHPEPAARAGILALGVRARAVSRRTLRTQLGKLPTREAPDAVLGWHAGQVLSVLGAAAPAAWVRAALAPLAENRFAPWSVLAADAVGERALAARGRRTLASAIASSAPHRGSVTIHEVPEVALTALAVEVLAGRRAHEGAVERARRFLLAQSFAVHVPAPLDAELARGAFPLGPNADFLRTDVTAHALLGLLRADARSKAYRGSEVRSAFGIDSAGEREGGGAPSHSAKRESA